MKNSEKPISPIYNSDGLVSIQSSLESKTHQQCLTGLTKREYFAVMAMQGILGNNRELDSLGGSPIKISQHCIEMADILLFELEKTKSE